MIDRTGISVLGLGVLVKGVLPTITKRPHVEYDSTKLHTIDADQQPFADTAYPGALAA